MEKKKTIIVLAGPSGCGKTYLRDTLVKRYPDIYKTAVQTTTRKMSMNYKLEIK